MKNSKLRKALMLVACAVLLVCLSVGATLAYLTSKTEVVTNTFTVGKVKITLDEAQVKEDGTVLVEPEKRVIQNSYTLQPGLTYPKDPTVTVLAKSEDCYVRIQVTVTDYDQLPVAFPDMDKYWAIENDTKVFLLQNVVNGWSSANWEYKNFTLTNENTGVYEFWYTSKVEYSDDNQVLDDLFESITMPADMTNDELAALENMQIKVVAHAIQADGFADADAAWAAWE